MAPGSWNRDLGAQPLSHPPPSTSARLGTSAPSSVSHHGSAWQTGGHASPTTRPQAHEGQWLPDPPRLTDFSGPEPEASMYVSR